MSLHVCVPPPTLEGSMIGFSLSYYFLHFTKPSRYQGLNPHGQVSQFHHVSPILLRSFAFQEMFKSVDILCVPATMDAGFDAEVRYPSKLNHESFPDYLGQLLPTATVSVLLCPALALPCGFLEDRLFRKWYQINQPPFCLALGRLCCKAP